MASGRRTRPWRRAIGSAGERLVHTEEVTGSIPVSPTKSEYVSLFSTPVTQAVYRHELRPVVTSGAEMMDRIFANGAT